MSSYQPEPEPRPVRGLRDRAPVDPLLVFETTRGRVRRCDCCSTLRVHFGAALMSADPAGFDGLLETVIGFDRGDTPLGPWPEGHALLHLGETGAAFAFTPAEITELHQLLAGAKLMLELGIGGPSADAADGPADDADTAGA